MPLRSSWTWQRSTARDDQHGMEQCQSEPARPCKKFQRECRAPRARPMYVCTLAAGDACIELYRLPVRGKLRAAMSMQVLE